MWPTNHLISHRNGGPEMRGNESDEAEARDKGEKKGR